MITLEKAILQTQNQLQTTIKKMFKGRSFLYMGEFLLVKGEAPIMLVAHMDTVHKNKVSEIFYSADKNKMMATEGIGGDDRCGVYGILKAYDKADVKPWLLFTCDEEIGGVGASKFCKRFKNKEFSKEVSQALSDLKLIIELDRKGSKDAVYYECDNKDFEAYISSKDFVTAVGSFSDISYVAPTLGVAAVNLSSGYYNAHTQYEVIVVSELEAVIKKVVEIINEAADKDFPSYEYIEAKPFSFDDTSYRYSLYDGYYDDYDYYDFPYGCGRYGSYGYNSNKKKKTNKSTASKKKASSNKKSAKSKYLDNADSFNYKQESLFNDDFAFFGDSTYELSREGVDKYMALLTIYSEAELNDLVASFGDNGIIELFEEEYGGWSGFFKYYGVSDLCTFFEGFST